MLSSIFARSRRVIGSQCHYGFTQLGIVLGGRFLGPNAHEIRKTESVQGKLYVCGNNWRQEASVQGRQQIVIAHGKTVTP